MSQDSNAKLYLLETRFPVMATLISALLLSFVPVSVYGAITLTTSGDLLTDSTISIVCSISSFDGTAGWINPSLSALAIHACVKTFCVPSNPTYPRYAFSTTSTTFTLNITNVTLNDVTWKCEHDTPAESNTITLDLKVAPTTCTLTESGGTYTCTTSCGYPVSDLYIHAKLNGTSNSQDLSPLNNESTPACTSPESAYSATVPTSFFTQDADLYCECGVTGYASTAVQSNSLAVTGTPSPTVPPKCSCSWLPCGWKCYYMYIIIVVVVVLLVVVTVSVCCCCRHGYCACCTCSACCRRKDNEDKYHVDDMNLNNHENGGRSNPSMRHDGTDM